MILHRKVEITEKDYRFGGPSVDEVRALRDGGWDIEFRESLDRPWVKLAFATKEVPDFAPHPTDEAY